jgi:hypothetical protein
VLSNNTTDKGTVSQVVGSWTVPTVTGSGTKYSSIWVGIDGYSTATVEQLGTEQDVVNGTPQYYSWYEMYPKPPVTIHHTTRPGDAMTASVTWDSGTTYTLAIQDVTQNWSFSINKTATAKRASAEWIVEAPSSTLGVLPLANFGTATFTGASATIQKTTGPIDNSTWQNAEITMVNSGGAAKATPGGLTDSGTPTTSSFSVTFNRSNGPMQGPGGPANEPLSAAQGAPGFPGQPVPAGTSGLTVSPAVAEVSPPAGGVPVAVQPAGRPAAPSQPVRPPVVKAGASQRPSLARLEVGGHGLAGEPGSVLLSTYGTGSPSQPLPASGDGPEHDRVFLNLDEAAVNRLILDEGRSAGLPGLEDGLWIAGDGPHALDTGALAALAMVAGCWHTRPEQGDQRLRRRHVL